MPPMVPSVLLVKSNVPAFDRPWFETEVNRIRAESMAASVNFFFFSGFGEPVERWFDTGGDFLAY